MPAGNLQLKKDDALFNEGDSADAMYVVRRGSLMVYLKKEDHEVRLAEVGTGGMIGEMAFFDKRPRSASVRAASDAEVTKITSEDFEKLMKQIPKWFVGIMSSLSVRLRDTNERLEKMERERSNTKAPFEEALRTLKLLNMVFAKDGVKAEKGISVTRSGAIEEISAVFGASKEWLDRLCESMIKAKILYASVDSYKNATLGIVNRGMLKQVVDGIEHFRKSFPDSRDLPPNVLEFLGALLKVAKDASYSGASVDLEQISVVGSGMGLLTDEWDKLAPTLKPYSDIVGLGTKGFTCKPNVEQLTVLLRQLQVISLLRKDQLA